MSPGHPRPLPMAVAVLALLVTSQAQAEPGPPQPGDDLTVSVLTFGPGSHPFFKFGHNALLVQPREGPGTVFNFGTFHFEKRDLIAKFVRGRFMYWLSTAPINATLASYRGANRTIEVQELDLTPAERHGLHQRLLENLRPENREYLYDYFWDNCSTRVRDALDVTLRGQLRAAGQAPGTMTFRAHALRLTSDLLWEYLALHLGLGGSNDRPTNAWQEAFLPEKLRDLLRTVRVERDGVARPLVKVESLLFAARRPPPPERPPRWEPWFALVGVGLGAALAVGGLVARGQPAARVALGVGAGVLGLLLGLLGLCQLGFWLFTNHKAMHASANILLCAPWAVALLPLGIGVALGRSWARRGAYGVAVGAAGLSLVAIAVKLLPGVAQENTAFILLLVPIWLGLAVGLRQVAVQRA